MRGVSLLAVVVAAALLVAGSAGARTDAAKAASVGVFPAATTIRASAPLPASPSASVALEAAIGEQEDAQIVVTGAQQVRIAAPQIAAPLQLKLFFAHYVSVDGTLVPDALLPWDGGQRATEQRNQPLWLQVTVPPGTAAGTYQGLVEVIADDQSTTVPISVKVFPTTLPAPNQVSGSLLTAFNVAAQSYGNKVNSLYGISGQTTVPQLYRFLASYRISPNSWGYGAPKSKSGYTSDKRWWMDNEGAMVSAVGAREFAAMAIPVSNNRTAKSNWIAGLSPNAPETWCSYLRSVHAFWQSHDWLASYPYLYGQDEPGLAGFKVVARQSKVVHACFPGGHTMVTGNPSTANRFLWNGGKDDVDDWVVLANRYYGKYTVPKLSRKGKSNATQKLKLINQVRKRGKMIWTYTYAGTKTPGFTATESLANPRLFVDWAALENIRGLLYGQGTTTYRSGNPLQSLDRAGAFVLVYPGKDAPVPSARLEMIRDGIEDWEILNVVRRKHGAAAVRSILGSLFSTTKSGAKLACTIGCPIKSKTPFSWPTWSQDATTPAKLDAAKAAALASAS
ncbi:MAG TPA: glycoside hydrolase domain-containing protein [Gaiellaceae bacterium]|nr:glycoside hydrolase domain-containing protein [Gaiellaceae bacterium]